MCEPNYLNYFTSLRFTSLACFLFPSCLPACVHLVGRRISLLGVLHPSLAAPTTNYHCWCWLQAATTHTTSHLLHLLLTHCTDAPGSGLPWLPTLPDPLPPRLSASAVPTTTTLQAHPDSAEQWNGNGSGLLLLLTPLPSLPSYHSLFAYLHLSQLPNSLFCSPLQTSRALSSPLYTFLLTRSLPPLLAPSYYCSCSHGPARPPAHAHPSDWSLVAAAYYHLPHALDEQQQGVLVA